MNVFNYIDVKDVLSFAFSIKTKPKGGGGFMIQVVPSVLKWLRWEAYRLNKT